MYFHPTHIPSLKDVNVIVVEESVQGLLYHYFTSKLYSIVTDFFSDHFLRQNRIDVPLPSPKCHLLK